MTNAFLTVLILSLLTGGLLVWRIIVALKVGFVIGGIFVGKFGIVKRSEEPRSFYLHLVGYTLFFGIATYFVMLRLYHVLLNW